MLTAIIENEGNIYPALLYIDACSSGEHWGTTFFTPKGVLSDQSANSEIRETVKNYTPYNYWYTPILEQDHHVDWESCPNKIKEMIEAATEQDQTNEVKLE